MLDDNPDRIAEMKRCLGDKFPFFELQFCQTASSAIRSLPERLPDIICISLDHDLEPVNADAGDPGTGRMLADCLARTAPACPVILHSTNRIAADGMEMVLVETGWSVERITPYEDCRWIAESWLPLIRNAVVATAASVASR